MSFVHELICELVHELRSRSQNEPSFPLLKFGLFINQAWKWSSSLARVQFEQNMNELLSSQTPSGSWTARLKYSPVATW